MPYVDDIDLKRLTGYDDKAEYELDLRGLDLDHARASVERMLERNRFRAPRSIIIRLDPAGPDSGETLFQPIGRQLLAARKKKVLAKLSPLPVTDGAGFYLVTAGKPETAADGNAEEDGRPTP